MTLWNRCTSRDRKMGQAWCKDRSTKAQDSKSPLDRVFLRCAHRIYPGLKEEGSVLGGATQRVTSSEIGYAGSPPRELLTRGRSIDSVDRPFQPSDWVDVNLEVPSTPRASSVTTNLTLDTTLYHTTSSCSNSKDIIPIPPPRRKRKNWSRPLPPKPGEDTRGGRSKSLVEPLYSSVIPKNRSYVRNKSDGRTKDIFQHKVNGTGKIIPSQVVSGWKSVEGLSPSQPELDTRNSRLSTVSLPNYDELNASKLGIVDSDDEEEATTKCNGIYQIDDSFNLAKRLRLDTGKTSTPKRDDSEVPRTPVKVDGWFLHSNIRNTRFEDSPPTEQATSESCRCPEGQPSELNPSGNPFEPFEDEIKNKTSSLDRRRDIESKKGLRRALSNESEPFEGVNEMRFSLEPMLLNHSPKMLTKSISEESFPSALLEDDVDFFEDKAVKDTKNEITKIREELEAVKKEVKTPSPSPEPKIKPELQSNDHSTLLKVLRDEAEESNLSSMTPSLTELEAALSDMLEKEADQENLNDSVSIIQTALKSLEKPIEPKIVPLITEEYPPAMLNVDSPRENGAEDSENVLGNCQDTVVAPEKIESKIYQFDAPDKPSRMYRTSLDSVERPSSIPTPPKRRNRSSGVLKEICDTHFNDRLI